MVSRKKNSAPEVEQVTKEFVTIGEAADILHISIDTIRRWEKAGTLTAQRLDGKNRYFDVEELEHFASTQPLSSTEVAGLLSVSPSTVRRLESQGLLIPIRSANGKRLYDRAMVDAYMAELANPVEAEQPEIITQLVESEGLEAETSEELLPVAAAETAHMPSFIKPPLQHASKPRKTISIPKVSRVKQIGWQHLHTWQKAILGAIVGFGAFVVCFTILFLTVPDTMARVFGYTQVTQTGKHYVAPKSPNIIAKIFRPVTDSALGVVDVVNPNLAEKINPTPIKNVNDIWYVDNQGNVTTKYSLAVPDSSYIHIPDQGMVTNLNAQLVQGRKPGENDGDLATLPLNGKFLSDGTVTSKQIAEGTIQANDLSASLRAALGIRSTGTDGSVTTTGSGSSGGTTYTSGSQGPPGPQGIQGPQGPAGPQGLQGPAGQNGTGQIDTINAGLGLNGGGSSSNVVLDVNVGDSTEIINDNIEVHVAGGGTTSTTSSPSGLEISAQGLRLVGGCTPGQILKWNGSVWACAADSGGGGGSVDVQSSDGSTIVSGASNIQFGPASSSADEFSLTNLGGGQVRVRLGTNVLMTTSYGLTLDPVYVNASEAPASGDISGSFTGGLTVASNAVALGTDTTGNYVATLAGSTGLTVTGSGSETAAVSVALDVITTGTTGTSSANSGLEVGADGLRLLGGCTPGQILKWNGSVWACAADATGAGAIDVKEGGSTVTTSATAIDFNASDFAVTNTVSQAGVAIDYTNSGITRRNGTEIIGGSWSFNDNSLTIQDNADNTKKAIFELSGITTGTTKTLTVPNVSGTLITSGNLTDITTVGTVTSGTWQGSTVAAQYGGTGVNGSAAANGSLLIGNGSGYSLSTLTQGSGITITNGAGSITIASTLGTSIDNSEIASDAVTLGTQTTGNYVASLGTLTGLSTSGNSGEGSTPTLSVTYGSAANTAVQGNTSITVTAGTNLSGGGSITLGSGGTVTLNTTANPTFGTSVTSPLFTNAGQVVLSATGAGNDVTITTADKLIFSGFNCTTFDNGGVLTVNVNGEVVCDNDDGGAAGSLTGSGTTNRIPLYTGTSSLGSSWLAQNGSTVEIDNTRNLSLLGGNLSVTGTGTFTSLITGQANTTGLALTGAPNNAGNTSLIQVGGAIAGGNSTTNGGTYIGLNAPGTGVGSAADFINLQLNGTSKFLVTNSGVVTATTFIGALTGNASTASALAANPTDCSANQFATAIAANGNLSCAALTDADIPNSITVDLATTASALAANPTDCSANQFANAIAANGNLTCAALTDGDVPDTLTIGASSTVSDSALSANVTKLGATLTKDEITNSGVLGFTWGDSEVSDTLTIGSGSTVADGALSVNVTKLGSTIDLATSEVSGNLKATNLQSAGSDLGAANVTVDLSNTNGSFVTNLTVDGTISAGTFSGNLSGNATTATALAANPTDCAANQFATAIAANGNLTCAAIAANNLPSVAADLGAANVTVDLSNTNGSFNTNLITDGTITATTFIGALTGNASTASALAANPTDCSANQFATAIAANGNLTCNTLTDADIPDTITINNATNATNATNLVGTGSTTNAVDLATAEVAGNLKATNLQTAGTDLGAANVNIDFTNTNGSFVTNLTVDGTITAATFSGNLTGNVTGNASTATALAANPADCGSNTFATTIAANGDLTCSSVSKSALANSGTLGFAWSDSEVSDTLTASIFVGSGSTTNAIDLATAEIAGTLGVGNGGTGLTSYTTGDLVYASGASTLGKLADVAVGSCLVSGGVGVAPQWGSCAAGGGITGSGTANTLPLFTSSGVLGDSWLSQSGSTLTVTSGKNLTLASGTVTATTFSGNLTGNVTGNVTGNADTASALAANPTDCSANQFATAIAANGNLTCAAIAANNLPSAGADLGAADINIDLSNTHAGFNTNLTVDGTVTATTFIGALTGNASTASALQNNPTDCATDTFATTIAANGNLSCSTVGKTALSSTGTLGFAWSDSEVSDTLTIGASSTVSDSALSANVTKLGATLTKDEITNSGVLGFTWGDSEVSDTLTIGSSSTVADGALSANVTKLGSAIDLATTEVSGNLKATSLQTAAADLGAANVTIDFSNTNGSFVTNLTVDGTITAGTFSGNLTGNVTGNASTASALLINPTDCSARNFATTIAANGDLTCATIKASDLPSAATDLGAANVNIDLSNTNGSFVTNLTIDGTITAATFSGNLTGNVTGNASTATALQNNPTDCSGSNFATAIDTGGNLTCSAVTKSVLSSSGTLGFTWSDAEVSDTLTASIFIGSGSTTNAVDLATAEVSGTLGDSNVSDTLTIGASSTVADGALSVNVTKLGSTIDLATSEVSGNLKATNLQTAGADLGAANVNIDLSNTNGSFVTNLTTDGTITAGSFSGNLTGNVTGNANTASALLNDPTDCSGNNFATAIAANGNLTCAAITKSVVSNTGTLGFTWADSEVSDTLTIGASSTVADGALSSNVTKLGATLTKDEITNSGVLGFTWGDSEVADNITLNTSTIITGTAGLSVSKTLSVNSGSTQNVQVVTFSSPADTSGTNVSQGLNIAATIGNATGGTNTANIFNIDAVTGDAEVTLNAIKVGNLMATGATETAINIGNNWDSVLTVGGTPIINGSGIVQSAGISGSYTGITGLGTVTTGVWQGTAIADTYVSDTITVGASGSVNDAALSVNVTKLGATLTKDEITNSGVLGFTWGDSEVSDTLTIGASSTVADGALSVNVTKLGNTIDLATSEVSGNLKATNLQSAATDLGGADVTVNLTNSNAGGFVTNLTLDGTITATTFVGALTGNAQTASALLTNPTDCGANTFATTIAANGNLTCAAIKASNLPTAPADLGAADVNIDLSNTNSTFTTNITTNGFIQAPLFAGPLLGNASTATALAADPTDCGANTFATTIANNGALGCSAVGKTALSNTGTLGFTWSDSEVSDTLTASIFVGSGSSTNAVDLATAEVSGNLKATNLQNAAADLGAANVTVDLSNTNGSFVTNFTVDGTIGTASVTTFTGAGATFSANLQVNGNTTLGDAGSDTITLNGTAVSVPNNLNFDSNTLFIDATNHRVAVGTNTATYKFDLRTPGVLASQFHVASTNTDAGGYLVSVNDAQLLGSGGASFNGTNWVAKATTGLIFGSSVGGDFIVQGNSGLTVGNTYTPTTRLTVNGSNGLATFTNNVAINGGTLSTSATSFDLLNTTATTINFGGGATTALNIGASTGTTNLNSNTQVAAGKTFAVLGAATTLTGAASGDAVTINNSTSTGNILALQDNGTAVFTVADGGGVSAQNTTNSTSAFAVKNTIGAPVLLVDTTTTNLITNSGFEVNTNGWSARGSATISQNVTGANAYNGLASLQIATGTVANNGASTNSFTQTVAAGTYTLSFYAKLVSGVFTTLRAGYNQGAGDVACTLNSNTLITGGFQRYTCTFTTTANLSTLWIDQGAAVTNVTIHIDSVQLESGSSATPYRIGAVQLRGVVSNPLILKSTSNSTSAFQIQDSAGTNNLFFADTINSRIGINKSSAAYALDVTGDINATSVFRANGTAGISVGACTASQYIGAARTIGGIVTAGTCTNDATGLSDVRLKKDITNIGSVLDQIKDINTYSFYYKCDEAEYADLSLDCDKQTGVIAQELIDIFPDLVHQRDDGYYEVNYRALGVYTLDAVTEIAQHLDSHGNADLATIHAQTIDVGSIITDNVSTPYRVAETINVGDVVIVDDQGLLHKSISAAQKGLAGIVTAGVNGDGKAMVGSSGRVRVNITGSVSAGDPLTSSNIPGLAMKATGPGAIIGVAASSGSGQVDVIVSTSFFGGNQADFDNLQNQITALQNNQVDLVNFHVGALTTDSDTFINGALTVASNANFNGEAFFANLVTFNKPVVFNDDIIFNGNVSFNSNTGGYAVISSGAHMVHVSFGKPYVQAPIINVNLNDGKFAQYSYTNVTTDGFDIILPANATQDLHFAWTALSVNNPNTFVQQ